MQWPWLIISQSVLWILALTISWELMHGHSIMTILIRSSVIALLVSSSVLCFGIIMLNYLTGPEPGKETVARETQPREDPSSTAAGAVKSQGAFSGKSERVPAEAEVKK